MERKIRLTQGFREGYDHMPLKAVYIGDDHTWTLMRERIQPDWDWQSPIPTIDAFQQALGNDEIERSSVILLSSQLYLDALLEDREAKTEKFTSFVRGASKGSALMLVDFYPELRTTIDRGLAVAGGPNLLCRYWWIDPQDPLPGMSLALKEYVNSDKANLMSSHEISVAWINGETRFDVGKGHKDVHVPEDRPVGALVTITSATGGSGKTTVALGLAQFLSLSSFKAVQEDMRARPLKICVVDLDVHNPQLGQIVGRMEPTVLDVLRYSGCTVDEEVLKRCVVHDKASGCDFLLAPEDPMLEDAVLVPMYMKVIDTLRGMYDIVLFDTSVDFLGELLSEYVYPMSHSIINLVEPDRRSIEGARRWTFFVGSPNDRGGAEIDLGKVSFVVNRIRKNMGVGTGEIQKAVFDAAADAHGLYDPEMEAGELHDPRLVEVIPEIPNGDLMRCHNGQEPWTALKIPDFEEAMTYLTTKIFAQTDGGFPDILDDVSQLVGCNDRIDEVFDEIVTSFTVDGRHGSAGKEELDG